MINSGREALIEIICASQAPMFEFTGLRCSPINEDFLLSEILIGSKDEGPLFISS